jgi:hypothetical protein
MTSPNSLLETNLQFGIIISNWRDLKKFSINTINNVDIINLVYSFVNLYPIMLPTANWEINYDDKI